LNIIKPRHIKLSLILILVLSAFLSGCQPSGKCRAKVLLIGLDGASWNVIQPLIKEGKLPNIKKLMDTGSHGVMQTFNPLESEIIWTSIATGKTPQKHGIISRRTEDPDSGKTVPVTSNLRRVKAIWNILSENRKRVGIVNYLMTWPVEEVNGVMISRMNIDMKDIAYSSEDLSFPAFTKICTKEEFEGFKDLKKSLFLRVKNDESPSFSGLIKKVDNFGVNFSKYLLRKESFDYFSLYIEGTDIVSHCAWVYSFPEGFNFPPDIPENKYLINSYYIYCDKIIGDIFSAAGNFDLVIICSDHGFMSKRLGEAYIFKKVDYLLEVCGIKEIKRAGKMIILENKPEDSRSFKKNIRIKGDITKSEFGEISGQAKDVLREIRVKETGGRIFSNIKDSKTGFVIELPDSYKRLNPEHHLIIAGKEYKITDFFKTELYASGEHSESAIIILSGKNIERNKVIKDATIYDITPTILYHLGLPVAKDMDGKVLSQAFKNEYSKKNPIKYIDTYDTGGEVKLEKPKRYPNEENIKEMMRSLGYIN
jgi:predicted AlkP superfamily phosphohydrolase/phosphomutase